MKKQISAALTAATLLFTSVAASADTATITASVLNVRTAPGAAVIGKLAFGESVTVLGSANGWCHIQYGDKTGYVYGSYVNITPDAAPVAETEESAPKTAGEAVVEYSKKFLGIPYVYGGSTPSGFDCSGFVKYVYANFGVSLPRTSYSQMYCGSAVSTADMQPGDLLVFRGGGHVGIYVGDGMYIHAPNTGRRISIDPLTRSITAVRRVL